MIESPESVIDNVSGTVTAAATLRDERVPAAPPSWPSVGRVAAVWDAFT